jgi:hypothetical protein
VNRREEYIHLGLQLSPKLIDARMFRHNIVCYVPFPFVLIPVTINTLPLFDTRMTTDDDDDLSVKRFC